MMYMTVRAFCVAGALLLQCLWCSVGDLYCVVHCFDAVWPMGWLQGMQETARTIVGGIDGKIIEFLSNNTTWPGHESL